MAIVKKIISGGQTGVDQAALKIGIDLGIEIGGWCPPGRVCENGKIPLEYNLKETETERSSKAPTVPRSLRTENNVRDSDATLILKPQGLKNDRGTEWTIKCAIDYQKPYLVIDPFKTDCDKAIHKWLSENNIQSINIAGPSEKTFSGINAQAQLILRQVFSFREQPAPSNNLLIENTQPAPWWVGVSVKLLNISNSNWRYFIFKISTICLCVFILIYVLNRFCGLRIEAGKLYLGGLQQTLGAHVTVDATAGFQNSGVYVKSGEKILLKPEGRIHIAMDHANNLAKTIKGILINDTTNKNFSTEQRRRYPKPQLDPSFVFYRDWCGPDGDATKSDLLEECKLRKDLNWGCLLAIIIPNDNISSKIDPFEILAANKLSPSQLIPINAAKEITIPYDGYLVFIINEAIISPVSNSIDAQRFYQTLKSTQGELVNDPIHQIPLTSIPLVWYADNNGAFRITVLKQ